MMKTKTNYSISYTQLAALKKEVDWLDNNLTSLYTCRKATEAPYLRRIHETRKVMHAKYQEYKIMESKLKKEELESEFNKYKFRRFNKLRNKRAI